MDRRELAGLLAGTVLVSIGGGIAALEMARGSYTGTLAGFALTLTGYRAAQFGAHGYPDPSTVLGRARQERRPAASRTLAFAAGLVLFSSGFVLGAQAGLQPGLAYRPVHMVGSGVIIVTGFLIMHRTLNDVIL